MCTTDLGGHQPQNEIRVTRCQRIGGLGGLVDNEVDTLTGVRMCPDSPACQLGRHGFPPHRLSVQAPAPISHSMNMNVSNATSNSIEPHLRMIELHRMYNSQFKASSAPSESPIGTVAIVLTPQQLQSVPLQLLQNSPCFACTSQTLHSDLLPE